MALTLTVETGAIVADANSYADAQQGDAYHEGRLHADLWTSADQATKEAALVWATRMLDGHVTWQGERKTVDQPLAWPRKHVTWDGHNVDDDTVPRPVRNAVIEMARLLIGTDLQAQQTADNIAGLNLGQTALKIDFKDGSETERVPLAIGELLEGLGAIRNSNGINSRKIVR